MPRNNTTNHAVIEQRYLEMYDELQLRASTVSRGLSRRDREELCAASRYRAKERLTAPLGAGIILLDLRIHRQMEFCVE